MIGKCVRAGYKPWKTASDGRPMWDYHQACTRLVRADYCGNGRAHTREGVRIEIIDRLKPEEEPNSGLEFEAAWTPEGATGVARPRLVTWSLEAIAAECPERVGDPAGCTLAAELGKPEVLSSTSRPSARAEAGSAGLAITVHSAAVSTARRRPRSGSVSTINRPALRVEGAASTQPSDPG